MTRRVWHILDSGQLPVPDDYFGARRQPFDRADYVRRLAELPGDWPPPEEL
jgi:hypothetical protein